MIKRLNKEYKLDVCDSISLKYGSVNREDPQVVYVNGRCWISPNSETDYKSVISLAEANMRKDIKKYLMDGINFDGKFIFDFDVNTDKIGPNVKKFLTFDLYAKQKSENKRNLKALRQVMESKIRVIADNLTATLNENDFSVSQKKK